MSVNIVVEHKVSGALKGVRADGVLSVTDGVIPMADSFMSHFVGPGISATDHASILFFLNPETGHHTILHYQPQYSQFPEYNRYYDTRIFYELTTDEFDKCHCSYAALADKLTLMKDYDQRYYGASNIISVDSAPVSPLSEVEEQILSALYYALANKKQLFIQLGVDDNVFGDEVRKSAKLKSLLRVFTSFPLELRRFLSLGYAVENISNGIKWLSPYLSVIAHCDSLSNWNVKDVVVVDWTKEFPIFPENYNLSPEQQNRIEVGIPMIPKNYGRSVLTSSELSSLLNSTADEIDEALKPSNNSVSDNDLALFILIYKNGKSTYRHQQIAYSLLVAALEGSHIEIKISELLKDYPEFRTEPSVQDIVVKRIMVDSDWSMLVDYDKEFGSSNIIVQAIRERLTSSLDLMDNCANNKDRPFSKKYQEDVKEAIRKQSNKVIIGRISNEYYGLSVSALHITAWKEFGELCDYINEKGLDKRLLAKLPYDLCWNDELHETTYNSIKERLNSKEKETLRNKCIKEYFKYPNQCFILGEDWLVEDEVYELLDSKSISKEDKKKLITDYLTRKKEYNLLPDSGLSDYYSFVAPQNRLSLAELAKCAISYAIGFEKPLLEDIKLASKIGETEQFKKTRDELQKLQINNIVEALDKQYTLIRLRSAPKTPAEIIATINIKDKESISLVINNNKLNEIYGDVDKFMEYYEELFGNKKYIKFLKKYHFKEAFEPIFQKKADEYVKKVLLSKRTLEEVDSVEYNSYPNASKYIISCLIELDAQNQKELYNICLTYYKQDKSQRVRLKNETFFMNVLSKLIPRWKGMNLDATPFLNNRKTSPILIVDLFNKYKYLCISFCAMILIGIVLLLSQKHASEPDPNPIQTLPPVTDSLYIRIIVGDADTDAMWQCFPLDSLHPSVILANTILDTLYEKVINCSISMYCVLYQDLTRNVSDTTQISFTKDNIHSVSRLLPIDSAYRSYLGSSFKIDNNVGDTIVFVCGQDTLLVTPKNGLLRQISCETKYRTDTVSFVIRGTDTIPLIFGDFIKKNTTRRYLQTTDYYLWVVQQLNLCGISII